MRSSYNIYSPKGYIGFCVIYYSDFDRLGNLILFDIDDNKGGSSVMAKPMNFTKNFPASAEDMTIIRELMQAAIPDFRINGVGYTVMKGGKVYGI